MKINNKYNEILIDIENQKLPKSFELKDFSFKEAENLVSMFNHKNLRFVIYEEFKVLYVGVYLK